MVDSLLNRTLILFLKYHHLYIVELSWVAWCSLYDLLMWSLFYLVIINFFSKLHCLVFLWLSVLGALLIHHLLVIGFSG